VPDVDLALALFAYAAASATDFLLTFPGLRANEIRELNPVLNAYIAHFGMAWGLLLPKLILGLLVIVTTSLFLHAKHRQHLTRSSPVRETSFPYDSRQVGLYRNSRFCLHGNLGEEIE
jgi:hypothetical protein